MEKLIPPIHSVYVLLGVVFVLAGLSLLVTIIMEMAALILNTRAKMLLSAIRELFQNDHKLFTQFTRHPRFRQIVGDTRGLSGAPKYLTPDSFADIFLEILQLRGLTEGSDAAVLAEVKSLDTFLKLKFEECKHDLFAFKDFLERWYSEKMDFASERYLKQVKYGLFFISLTIAVLFNADIIGVYSRISGSLKTNSVDVMNSVASNLDKLMTLDPALRDSTAVRRIESKLLVLMEESLELDQENILGYEQAEPGTLRVWLVRLIGYLISALLLAYGAQVWFEWVRMAFALKATNSQPPPPPTVAVPPPA